MKISSKEAWLQTQQFNGPTVDAVRFLGYDYDYPEWFVNFMEDDIFLEFGTYFYADIAVTVGGYFLRNRLNHICYIEAEDFNRLYCTLPF